MTKTSSNREPLHTTKEKRNTESNQQNKQRETFNRKYKTINKKSTITKSHTSTQNEQIQIMGNLSKIANKI